jgi:hypothetical protein
MTMSEGEREYTYKPRWTVILACAAFFGLAAGILGIKAWSNDRGLLINGIIELSADAATVFYWILCALGVGFVAVAVLLACHRLLYRQRIAFTATSLIVPKSRWSSEESIIEYNAVVGLAMEKVSGQQFLRIMHTKGKHTITASLLPSQADFEEVCALLAERVRIARPVGRG